MESLLGLLIILGAFCYGIIKLVGYALESKDKADSVYSVEDVESPEEVKSIILKGTRSVATDLKEIKEKLLTLDKQYTGVAELLEIIEEASIMNSDVTSYARKSDCDIKILDEMYSEVIDKYLQVVDDLDELTTVAIKV